MTNYDAEQGETPEGGDFLSFGFPEAVLKGIETAGFTVPSPIQKQAIPVILEGRDLIGQAHTGTGKTAAFGLAALSRIQQTGQVEVLVITPTRELATQVSEEIYRLGQYVPVRTIPIYGGQPYGRQIEAIRRGVQVVVATPGRLLDLLDNEKTRQAFRPGLVVLDEADEMLDMGFIEDVKKILEYMPEERQTLLFSATIPRPVQELAEKFLKDPVLVRVDQGEESAPDIQQQYYIIDEHERDDATVRLIDSLEPTRAMIFCRTKGEVDRLAGILAARGVLAQSLHGDMEQPMRERVLNAFRSGDFQVLVATDVAARGLDVPDVSHVFNYHIPFDPNSYVHRIGRTGRAGRKGVAVTLVTPQEYHSLRRIQSKVGKMEHNLVPSHRELKEANEAKLLESIQSQATGPETERFVTVLEEEIGLHRAARKMAALLLAREEVTGPDHIGLQGERLERIKEGPRKRAEAGKKGFGAKGRPAYEKRGGFAGKESGFKKRAGEKPGFGFKKRATEGGEAEESGFKKRTGGEYARKERGGFEKPGFKKRAEGKPEYGFKKRGEEKSEYGFKKRSGEKPDYGYKKRGAEGYEPGIKRRGGEREEGEESGARKRPAGKGGFGFPKRSAGAGFEGGGYKKRTGEKGGFGFKKRTGEYGAKEREGGEEAGGYKKRAGAKPGFGFKKSRAGEGGYKAKPKSAKAQYAKKRSAGAEETPFWVSQKKHKKG